MGRRILRTVAAGEFLAVPLATEAWQAAQVPMGRPSRAPRLCRVMLSVIALAAFGCASATEQAGWPGTPWALVAFLLLGGALYLVVSGTLVVVSRRRRRRRLGGIFVAVVTGSVCGAFWILILATVVNAARPGIIMGPAVLGVGMVTGLGVSIFLSRRNRLREVARRSVMTIGFHSLALPIGALAAFVVAGAQWSPATSVRPVVAAVILGIRLAGDPSTIGLSVGGLVLGVFLIFIGDRVLRTVDTPARARTR